MKKIVLDIETRNSFQMVNSTNPQDLDLALLVLYDYETDEYQSFWQEDLSKLWPILENTDLIIGYNQINFDLPLLNKYYPGNLGLIKQVDLLDEIYKSLGKRIRLDMVAEGTLGIKKSGHGLEAVKWWKQGEKDKISAYCHEDVRITKELYDYALLNKKLKYKLVEDILEISLNPINWESPQSPKINYTLPF